MRKEYKPMKRRKVTGFSRVPNHWLAKKIGYTDAGVSLVRNAKRRPSLNFMAAIEEATGWPATEQLAYRDDDYVLHLEEALDKAWRAERAAGRRKL